MNEISGAYFHVNKENEKRSICCDDRKIKAIQTKYVKHIYIHLHRSIYPQSSVVKVSAKSEVSLVPGFFVSGPETDKRKC